VLMDEMMANVRIEIIYCKSYTRQNLMDMVNDISQDYHLPENLTNNLKEYLLKNNIKEKIDQDLKFVFSILPEQLFDEATNFLFRQGVAGCPLFCNLNEKQITFVIK